jgi:hypothetical protein
MAKQKSSSKISQSQPKSSKQVGWVTAFVASSVSAIVTAFIFSHNQPKIKKNQPTAASTEASTTLLTNSLMQQLLGTPSVPENADIAWLNLACSPEITDAESSITDSAAMSARLNTLKMWSTQIAELTTRNYHRYTENPGEYKNEAEWRLAMMRTIIGQDFRVKYDETLSTSTVQTSSNREFFANPQPIFLTGCLDEKRTGTCASLPVLYVAVGRRMGYPMYLVAAKGHLFARWDDGKGTRVNLETAGGDGFVSSPDEYYRTWPQAISAQEEQENSYLKNLTAREGLAIFLSNRSANLLANGKKQEAIIAATAAFRLAPNLGGIGESLRTSVEGFNDQLYATIHQLQEKLTERDSPYQDRESPHFNQPIISGAPQIPGQLPFPQPPINRGWPQPSLPITPDSNPFAPRQPLQPFELDPKTRPAVG